MSRPTRRRRLVVVALIVVAAAAVWPIVTPYTRAAALVIIGAEIDGWPRMLARLHEQAVTGRLITVPTREGRLRAREYRPAGRVRQTAVLITGVHPAGIDDPRLMHFARSFASAGIAVVTPELPRLIAFEITPGVTDAIEDVTAWAADARTPGGPVGLVGISFSGGLAIVAAGRDSIRDRVAFVLSVGGHGDLLRTLDTLAGGILTADTAAWTDPFGLALVLPSVAPDLVPPEQVDPLRAWARTYLGAAHLPFGHPERERLSSHADRLAAELLPPAGQLAAHILAADVAALRPHMLQPVRDLAAHAALSPERAPPPRAPVYLLHGTEDDVIPPEEARSLAEHLRRSTRVHLLLTPVLAHADLGEELRAGDAADLVRFFARLLRQ